MPTVIGGVTWASKKWGNQVGGILASLPWSAAPIMLFFTLEQGVDFTVHSIKGVMIGIIGVLLFTLTYMYSAIKFRWYVSILLAYLAFLLVSVTFNAFESLMNLNAWYILAIVLSLLGLKVFPKIKPQDSHGVSLKYDLYLRMIIVTLFVVLLTFLAKYIGPTWSGILTPFPIVTAILAAFTHYTQGVYGTSTILKGMLIGYVGFATFLFLQAIFLPHYSIFVSFFIGFIVNILLNLLMRFLVKRFASA